MNNQNVTYTSKR